MCEDRPTVGYRRVWDLPAPVTVTDVGCSARSPRGAAAACQAAGWPARYGSGMTATSDLAASYAEELTDAQWVKLAPLLPPQRLRMGRPPKDHRLIVEAIVWLDRTGAPWRDLPSQFGPWETVASRSCRWRRQGIWDRVLAALQADTDARGELDWLLHFVDGSVVRAHQHAAGARRRPATADLDTGDSGRS
jgi:transposase